MKSFTSATKTPLLAVNYNWLQLFFFLALLIYNLGCSNKPAPKRINGNEPAGGITQGGDTSHGGSQTPRNTPPANNLWDLPPSADSIAGGTPSNNKEVSWESGLESPWGPLNQLEAILLDVNSSAEEINRKVHPQVLLKISDPQNNLAYVESIFPVLTAKGYRFYFSFENSAAIKSFEAFLAKNAASIKEVFIQQRTLDQGLLTILTSNSLQSLANKIHWITSDNGSTSRDAIVNSYSWIKPPQLYAVSMTLTIGGNSPDETRGAAKTAFDTCFDHAKDIKGNSSVSLNHPQGAGLAYDYLLTMDATQRPAFLLYLIASLNACNVIAANSKDGFPAIPKLVVYGKFSQFSDNEFRLINSTNQHTTINAALRWPTAYRTVGDLFDNAFLGTSGNVLPIVGMVIEGNGSKFLYTANISSEKTHVNLSTPGIQFDIDAWQVHFKTLSSQ